MLFQLIQIHHRSTTTKIPLPLQANFITISISPVHKRMNRRNINRNRNRNTINNIPELDLKLSLSPSRGMESPSRSSTMSSASPPSSSCVTSLETNQDESSTMLRFTSSPDATSMVLVGCPRCLMYVMLSAEDPKCPQCKSTVLLDVLHDDSNNRRGRK